MKKNHKFDVVLFLLHLKESEEQGGVRRCFAPDVLIDNFSVSEIYDFVRYRNDRGFRYE